jgi:DNA-binding NarL/FixJ family response regulator
MLPREQLNSREIKVTTLVWQGRTNPEIAGMLGTSEQVV